MRGARPTTGGWSEPRRRPVDWPPSYTPEAQDPDGLPRHQDHSGNGATSQTWPPEPAATQPWHAQPLPDQPWHAEPLSQPWETAPAEALHAPGQLDGAPPPDQPWAMEQPPGAGASPDQPWAAEPPSQSWGTPLAPGRPDDTGAPSSQPWGDEPQLSQAWGVAPASGQRLAVERSRAQRVTARSGGSPRPGGLQVRGWMALAIAIPLIASLVLLVTAGSGRILPSRDQQAAAKRPVAAPVQPGDANRLVSLINQERARNGLPAMLVLRRLNAAAAAHAAEMASQKRIQPDPNIAASVRPATSVSQYVDCASNIDQVYQRMMASAAFRAKALSPSLNGIGMGSVSGNCLWVTVLFARATPPQSASKPASPLGGGSAATPAEAPPPPAQPASPAQGPARPASTAEAIAKDLFARANAERKARGQAPLVWSDDLARLATDWSGQMARTNRFVHRDLDAARGKPGIGQFSALGENIAWVRGYDDDAYELHLGWMRSEGHRHNLLQPGFDRVGIGVVCSGGKAWATQNFGRLSASAPKLSSSIPASEPIVATAKAGLSCG